MKLQIEEIATGLGLTAADTPVKAASITCFLTDSRSLSQPHTTLFFALETPSNDGHRYIGQLYGRGVRNFVVSRIPANAATDFRDANFLKVDSPLEALHTLAAANRSRAHSLEVVAIAGSRGKTTLKEWLFQAVNSRLKPIARSPRSFNSQIGVALSLMAIDSDTRLAIIEAGISRPGEMGRLEAMIKPTLGIFANLLSDHSDGFPGGDLQKCREKALLFENCRSIVYCRDNEMIASAVDATVGPQCDCWGWSARGAAGARINFEITADEPGRPDSRRVAITMPDGSRATASVDYCTAHDLENICHIGATLAAMGWQATGIADALAKLKPVVTRTDVVEGINGSTIIHDRYSSDLTSLDMALDFMGRRLPKARSGAAVIGDLSDDPSYAEPALYEALAETLRERGISDIVAVGPMLKAMAPVWRRNEFAAAPVFETVDELLAAIGSTGLENRPVLVKGPWGAGLERVAEHLEARRHETVLDVNLDAIVGNFNFYKSRLRPTTGIVCMVKAFGYGAGSYELAKTLQSQGAAYLAVAVIDEGVELRNAGITMPIMVMNPRVVNYEEMFANRLEPEIFSFDELNEIISQAERLGVSNYPIHIKFDTGMHRLGFVEEDLPALAAVLKATTLVRPASMFSHLAAADDPALDDYTRRQFERFDRWCDTLQSHFSYHINRHILNSTGITRFPDHQHDLVRLGICLYGVPTMADGSQEGLRRVSALRTTVISIKEWPAGTPIGYNCRGVCSRPSRIATIPIGYADGIDRHFGNGALKVWINGHRCPTIGNICMDACMIDVTDCGADCRVGDSVEIFGDHVDVAELAAILNTIPYEILTSVSTRVKRVYYRE